MGGDPLGLLNRISGAAPGPDEAAANAQWLQQQSIPGQGSVPGQASGQGAPGQGQPGQGPAPSQGDSFQQMMQPLAQRIGQYQQQQSVPANQGGNIKRLLSNFFEGAGSAMMQHAGLPTPYEQNQKDIQNYTQLQNAQANAGLHTAMAGMYGTVPIQVPDNSDPSGFSTINVMQKDVPTIQKAQIAAGARTQSAGITGQYGVQRAQIMAGPPVNLPPEMQNMGLPPQLPLRQAGQAQQLLTRPLAIEQGTNGPSVVNKLNPGAGGVPVPGVGNPRAMFAPGNRYGGFVDPNNPDNIVPMTYGQAAAQGAAMPQSVGFQANKAVTKSATSGPIANQLTAFNTALQHADLLRQAAKALNNGDTRTLNSISNRAASEFGDPALTTAQAIAGAYTREVTAMLSKGHLTDSEIGATGATMPLNANYKTIDSVLGAYENLARSKMNVLKNQVMQGKQGQPAFNTPSAGGPPQHLLGGSAQGLPEGTTGNQGKYIVRGGQWVVR